MQVMNLPLLCGIALSQPVTAVNLLLFFLDRPMSALLMLTCCSFDILFCKGGNSAISEKWRKEYLPEFCVTSVEIFDPETETWSEGPSLSNALCGAGK